MEPIEVEYVYTLDEAVLAATESSNSSENKSQSTRSYPAIGAFVLLCVLILPVVWFHDAWQTDPAVMIVAILIGVFFLAFNPFMRWFWRWIASKRWNLNATIWWKIADSELRNGTDGMESRLSWDNFFEMVETNSGFLLRPNPKSEYWLPKHGFKVPDNIEAFRQLVKSKNITYRTSGTEK
jgi:hypothetical protein